MERDIAVRLKDIRLAYEGRALFEGLDLDLEAGAFTCLLGPSGVGKSTLLRLIAGLERPAGGRVVSGDGHPLGEGLVAYMAQQDLLLPWSSALDNVLLGPRLRGERIDRRLRERARSLLERVGLGERGEARPGELSGGMRQRVALARTLFEDRPIVLMDEPFAAVDAITRRGLQALARELLAGRTVLLVTHDPLEALRIADTVLVLHGMPARLGRPVRPRKGLVVPAGGLVEEAAAAPMIGGLMARLAGLEDCEARQGALPGLTRPGAA